MPEDTVKKPLAFLTPVKPFVVGGLSGCVATMCVQPIDMVKVRIQLMGEGGGAIQSKNPLRVASSIIKSEGFFSLYKGLDAGIIRQLTYTTARLGLFRVISDKLQELEQKSKAPDGPKVALPLWKKAVAGLAAGALGSIAGNPADLALIRMQADATLPVDQRRNYTGCVNAISRIIKEEGLFAIWRGVFPTLLRASALNAGMLATNDQCKEMFTPILGKGWSTVLAASAVSGFFAVTMSLPFDFLKTRLQKMRPDPKTGALPYKGIVDAAVKITKSEGLGAFYSGYPTYYMRIAPHAMITLISLEVMNRMFKPFF